MSPFRKSAICVVGKLLFSVVLVISHTAPANAADDDTASRHATLTPLDADAYWKWAEKKDAGQAYRCFVYHYPDDPRVAKAKQRWAELDFLVVEEDGKRPAYRWFLHRHPQSRFAAMAAVRAKPVNRNEPGSPLRQQSLDALLAALKDSDSEVRFTATCALGYNIDPRAVDVLLAALKDSDAEVRATATRALSWIVEPRAVDFFLHAVKHPKVWNQPRAAEALGRISDARAVDAQLAMLKDSDRGVRLSAARALGVAGE